MVSKSQYNNLSRVLNDFTERSIQISIGGFMNDGITYGTWDELKSQEIRERRDREPDPQLTRGEAHPDFVSLLYYSIREYDPDRSKALDIFEKYCIQ